MLRLFRRHTPYVERSPSGEYSFNFHARPSSTDRCTLHTPRAPIQQTGPRLWLICAVVFSTLSGCVLLLEILT